MGRKATLHLNLELAFGALLLAVLVLINRDDIEVTVHNLGPDTLESVIIGTDQASYPIGDIRARESGVVGIDVLGDSSLSVRHAGHLEWQTTNTYMTRGFTGRMSVMLENGNLVGFTEDLDICILRC